MPAGGLALIGLAFLFLLFLVNLLPFFLNNGVGYPKSDRNTDGNAKHNGETLFNIDKHERYQANGQYHHIAQDGFHLFKVVHLFVNDSNFLFRVCLFLAFQLYHRRGRILNKSPVRQFFQYGLQEFFRIL